MSYVTINAVEVPPESSDEFRRRFAARAGEVGKAAGFEAFELLVPQTGTTKVLVYTRWRSKEDFEAWVASPSFAHAHSQGGGPVGTHSELWAFDAVQTEYSTASDS